MLWRLATLLVMLSSGCLSAWDLGGPWKCGANDSCPTGYSCDDAICCKPGGLPACPTLPAPNGKCFDGGQPSVFFQDSDADLDGNPRVATVRCRAPSTGGWVLSGFDCDDTNASIHRGGAETCNGQDDNCDGVVDEGLTPRDKYFADSDGDGFGDEGVVLEACATPPGYVKRGGDCAPFDVAKFPGAAESCNNLDDDCDGVPDGLETTFADVDSPSHPLPCLTAASGVCQAGAFTCATQSNGTVQRVCVSKVQGGPEVCDGLDNDCDGAIDEPPECGGPASLLNLPFATYSAFRLTVTNLLATQCQKGVASVSETATADGVWLGSGTSGSSTYHVWSVEAPAGTWWDLSNPNDTLLISLAATANGVSPTVGAWGNWTAGSAIHPVVYLCGETVDQVMRYRLANGDDGFKLNDSVFEHRLQLNAADGGWIIGQGSGFDTSRVKRVELMVQSFASDFSITVRVSSGFGK